ncbi:outer membrane autotransporter barrel domain protein [Lysobacter capsici]|nr:outer membrane autotransporter barrel domain protein [Lysobacter capsici]
MTNMQQQSARHAGGSFVSRLHTVLRSGLFVLCGLAALWAGSAAAAPSAFCPVLTMSVANGGNQTIDVSTCDGPADFGLAVATYPTPHGSASVQTVAQSVQTLTYTHNGDSALSDTFLVPDGNGGDITVNVTIAPGVSPLTVSPATINPALGVAYSQTMSTTGGVGPYTYVRTSGALPNGLNFSNGTFSGTVRQRGNFPIAITVTDSTTPTAISVVKSYQITIPNNQPVIGPDPLPAMTRNYPYSAQLTSTGGNAPYTYSINSGALPPGLSLSGTGAITGTPTTTGNYSFTVRSVDDSDLGPGVPAIAFGIKTYNVSVALEPTIVVNPATIPGATVGVAYSQTFTGGGGTAPYTFAISAGALPAGLSLNTTSGALTGTPTAAGTFNFTVRATDANSFAGTRAYTLVVAPPVTLIAPTTLPNGTVAAAYSQAITASGGIAPYTYAITAGALPAGLTLSSAGALSGTPTAGGTFNFTVTATGSSTGTGAPHTGARAYALVIAPPTVLLPATSFAPATVAVAYSANLNPASGGTAPYTYALSAGALPPGMSLSSTGTLSGTPTAPGTFNFAVTATDSSTGSGAYSSAPRGYTLQVVNIPPVANPVSATVAYNSTANPITLNITGGVPTSVAIGTAAAHGTATATGATITYTPTAGYAGPDSFTYTATNTAGTSAPATVTITVTAPTITVSASGPLTAQIGVAYTQTFTWTGGTSPFSGFAVTGLPAGLSITGTTATSVTVSGTPSAAGSFALNTSATDSSTGDGPFTIGQAFTLTVSAPTLTLTPAAGTLNATYGAAYSQTFVAGGGTAPYNYSISAGALPAGLSLDANTGVLSGTPSVTGLFTFSVRARDSSTGSGAPFARTQNYVMQVAAPTIVIAPPTLPGAQVATAYSQTLSASGGIGAYTFAVTAGALPPGVSLSSAGTIAGTPSAGGTFNFTVTASDANVQSGSRAYSLTVSAATIVVSPTTLPGGGVAQAYSQTVTASGGTAGYTFAITAGALPAGLSLASNGTLSGTPSAGGTFNFTITATDSSTGSGPYTGSRAYSVTIAASTVILPPTTLAAATVTNPYNATVNAATGGTAPYTYAVSAGSLPPGLSVSSAGVISGTPTAPGSYSFSLRATDSSTGTGPYTSAPQTYALQVNDIVPVANPVSATVAFNSTANPITLNITGGIPASVAVAAAPAHGTATASGTTITYTPTAGYAGPDTFTYTATNVAGTSAPATVTITVGNPTITVTASGPLTAQVGSPYSQTFTWAGGTSPYSGFGVTGLPAGLSVTGTTADSVTVSGTPTAAGSFALNASAADSSTGNGPFTTAQAFTLTVSAPTLAMTPAPGNLPMNYGVASTINFAASGGSAPYSFSLAAGSLPVGVSFSSAGVLSGTPTVPGNYNIAVRVLDSSTGAGAPFALQQNYTIVVATPAIAIDPPTLPNGTAAVAYNASLSSTGGVAPYSYSLLSGALPIGMSFSSAGVFSGIPRSDGNFSVTVQSTDNNGQTGSKVYTFTIDPAIVTIAPATLPGGTVGLAYNQSLSSSGGIAPYSYSIVSGNLPIGLSFSSAGVLSGTPTTAGSYTANIRSTDDAGYNTTAPYTIVIADAVPVAVDDSASTLSNAPVTIDVTANDTGIITSIALATAPAHGTATVSGTDVIYTPAANYFGSDSFTYTASGPGGTSAPATVTITVNALPVPQGQPQTATTLSTQPVTIDAATGATGSPFTGVTLLNPPSSGTAVVQGTQIVYTPAATTVGAIALTYTLNNAFGPSAPITSTITVNAVPVAQSRRVRTVAGATITVDLVAGATGGPFTGANLVSLTPASSGTAAVSGSGGSYQLTYTPVIGYSGIAVASFTLNNAFATSAVATIEVEVMPRSDPSKDAEVLGLLSAQTSATRRFATTQIGNFQQRLEGLHGGGEEGARFDNGLSFSIDPRCRDDAPRTPGNDCRQPMLGDERAAIESKPPVQGTGSRYGLWTGGTLNSGNRDGRSGGASGIDFETTGISAGADYRLRDDFALGGGIGYGRDDTEVGQHGSRSKAHGYSAVLYASYHPGKSFYLDGLLGYQWLSFDSRRFVTDTGGMVTGSRDGNQWFASISAGADYQRDRLRISPYARLDVARARLDGYTERGDAQYVLNYRDQDIDTTTTSLGLRMDYIYPVRWGTFAPQLRLEYQHDFQDDSFATMSYADMVGGPFYRARIDGLDRNRFVFGLGAILQTERDWVLRFEYRGLFGSGNDDDNSFMINLEKKY